MKPEGYRFLNDIIPDLNYVIDKRKSAKAYYSYFLNRCVEMFEYKNLPDTIPHEILDKYLFCNGIACITKDPDSQLRVFYGNLGGVQDCYYRPTRFIIANPHFKTTFSKEAIVLGDEKHDGVLLRNDSCWLGLHPMLSRYSCLLAENTLTLRVSDVLLRITAMLSAPTDKEKIAAQEFIDSIEDGRLSVIGENPFFEGIKMQNPPSNNGSYLTQFIEYQQYLKGSFYNEIGLSANYNMKREAIGKGESTLDQDALLPLCENMLKCRQEDLTKVNEMFGTNILVDFSSSWKENMLEAKLALLSMSTEAGLSLPTTSTTSTSSQSGGAELTKDVSGGDQVESTSVEIESQDEPEVGGDDVNDEEAAIEEQSTDTVEGSETESAKENDIGDTAGAGDNEESKVNDISVDETFAQLDKKLDEALSILEAEKQEPIMMEGDDENGFGSVDEETSDGEGDISGS